MKKNIKIMLAKYTFFKDYFRLKEIQIPISLNQYIKYRFFNKNKKIYWPVHKNSIVVGNVKIGINSSVGAAPGCYIQGIGEIEIGNYTIVAPNVGIISANHNLYNYYLHDKSKVKIGDYCWIGMNSVILPGVELGNHVIVAAGSVVTKSFQQGYCIIGGTPARVIKSLDKESCIDYKAKYEYYGYIPKEKFINKYNI